MPPSPYRIPARTDAGAHDLRAVELDFEWLVLALATFALVMGIVRDGVGAFEAVCAMVAWASARAIVDAWRGRYGRASCRVCSRVRG